MKISNESSIAAYDISKLVYAGEVTREEGINLLATQHSLNRNTAAYYLGIFACMMDGRIYKRTNNAFATDYFLTKFYDDFGNDGLRNALTAVELHRTYYEELKKTKLGSIREIQVKHAARLNQNDLTVFPDEVLGEEALFEGAVTKVSVNAYERNPVARKVCIEHYGSSCCVCDFDFESEYGVLGRDFIHVHHVIDISTVDSKYIVDPIKDLRPVCPNCHAMLHRTRPAMKVEDLKVHLTR